jgi:nucleotide-binding universal stress UspA family protein
MIKNILIPTDFSKEADYALDFAIEMAKSTQIKLHLLHVIESPSAYEGSFNVEGEVAHDGPAEEIVFTKALVAQARKKMEILKAKVIAAKVHGHSHMQMGNPFRSVLDMVDEHKMDMIIMGTKGSHGIDEVMVGSNTEKVVRNATVPVLAIKADISKSSMRNIVFASEFNDSLINVMPMVKEIQKMFNSKLNLLRINTPNDFHTSRTMRKQMTDFAEKNKLENYTINTYADIIEEDGIVYFAEEINADLIIMPTHGRKGLMHLLSGSIAEDIVNHAKRPVMTIKL